MVGSAAHPGLRDLALGFANNGDEGEEVFDAEERAEDGGGDEVEKFEVEAGGEEGARVGCWCEGAEHGEFGGEGGALVFG